MVWKGNFRAVVQGGTIYEKYQFRDWNEKFQKLSESKDGHKSVSPDILGTHFFYYPCRIRIKNSEESGYGIYAFLTNCLV